MPTSFVCVSAHAIDMYRERVYPCPPEQAQREIEEAFARPLFVCPSSRGDALLWGLRNRGGFPFIAVTNLEGERLEVQTVGPCYYWHEAKPYYRRHIRLRRRKHDPVRRATTLL